MFSLKHIPPIQSRTNARKQEENTEDSETNYKLDRKKCRGNESWRSSVVSLTKRLLFLRNRNNTRR